MRVAPVAGSSWLAGRSTTAAPAPHVCGDPDRPCLGFKPNDLSLALPNDPNTPSYSGSRAYAGWRSAPFYGVILRIAARGRGVACAAIDLHTPSASPYLAEVPQMTHRTLIRSALACLAVGFVAVAGCTPGESGDTGAAGKGSGTGTAGTGSAQGTAGTGSAQGTAGTGNTQGTAGTGSAQGTAGTGSAQAGTNGGAGTGAVVTGTAGTGAAGTQGAAGTTGGGRPSGPSAGCDMPPPAGEALGKSVSHTITVTGMDPKYAAYVNRSYCTKVPTNYDPSKPYPVVYYGGGCGAFGCEGGGSFGSRTDIILIEANISHADKNLVPPGAAPGCFQAGVVVTPDSPEGYLFDQVMDEVEKKYCIDKGRVFASGTSSGAWLSNYLACAKAPRVRGTAADSGGIGFDHGTCKTGAAVMLMPGDSANKQNGGNEIGAAVARDLFIKLNGCSMTPTSMKLGDDTCDVYGGCTSPVAWCNVGGGHQSGQGHLSKTGFAFWDMLK